MFNNKSIKIIGACCKYGQPKNGVQKAPQLLHKYFNNLPFIFINNFEDDGYKDLFNNHNILLQKNKVITIGGDHSISSSTVASAFQKYKENLKIVWVDAHADINTRQSSITKNIHGMPVASLIGTDNIFGFPTINSDQITYIGLRDLDEYESNIIKELNIKKYDIFDIKFRGIDDIITEIIENNNILDEKTVVHLSFDVDAIDPNIFPSTGTPVENGLSLFEAYMILGRLKDKIVSADFVEFNPELSNNGIKEKDARQLSNLIKLLL